VIGAAVLAQPIRMPFSAGSKHCALVQKSSTGTRPSRRQAHSAAPPIVRSTHCIFIESLHRDFVVFNTYGNHRHTWLLSEAM